MTTTNQYRGGNVSRSIRTAALIFLALTIVGCTMTSRYVLSSPVFEEGANSDLPTPEPMRVVPSSFFNLTTNDLYIKIVTNARLHIKDSLGALKLEPISIDVSAEEGKSIYPLQLAIAVLTLRPPTSLRSVSGEVLFTGGRRLSPEKISLVDGPCLNGSDQVWKSSPPSGDALAVPAKEPGNANYRAGHRALCLLFTYTEVVDPRMSFSVQVGELINAEGIASPLRIGFRPALFDGD